MVQYVQTDISSYISSFISLSDCWWNILWLCQRVMSQGTQTVLIFYSSQGGKSTCRVVSGAHVSDPFASSDIRPVCPAILPLRTPEVPVRPSSRRKMDNLVIKLNTQDCECYSSGTGGDICSTFSVSDSVNFLSSRGSTSAAVLTVEKNCNLLILNPAWFE